MGAFSNKGYKFNQRAMEYAPIFKGTVHEANYWAWRSNQTNPNESGFLVPRQKIRQGTSTYVGLDLLLSSVAKELKLDQLLVQAFGVSLSQNILAIAYYCASHVRRPLSESISWSEHQHLPGEVKLSADTIDKTLQSITEKSIEKFMKLWQKDHSSDDPLSVEIKPVNSRHRNNEEIALGVFQYLNSMEPIRLLVTLDRETHVPVNYSIIPSDEPDVITINNITAILQRHKITSGSIVLGRSFSVFRNISYMLRNKINFTIVVSFEDLPNYQIEIDELKEKDEFNKSGSQLEIFQRDEILKVQAVTKIHVLGGNTVYLHYYYIDEYRTRTLAQFKDRLDRIQWRLEKGLPLRNTHDQMLVDQYFTVTISSKSGRTVKRKRTEVIDQTIQNRAGYFAVMSNCLKDPADALKAYKAREGLEDRFDDQKMEEDFYRLKIYSLGAERAIVFIQYVAQIFRLYLLDRLHKWKNKPESVRSVTELVWAMAQLREISISGHNPFLEQPDETQKAILDEFGIMLR